MKRHIQLWFQKFDDWFRGDGQVFAPGAGKMLLGGLLMPLLVLGGAVWVGHGVISDYQQRRREAVVLERLEAGESLPLFISGWGSRPGLQCKPGFTTCIVTIYYQDPYLEEIVFSPSNGAIIEDRYRPTAGVPKEVLKNTQWTVKVVGDGDPNRPKLPPGCSWKVVECQSDDPGIEETKEWIKRKIRASFPPRVFLRFYPGRR